MASEHLFWDQGSVLAQLGVIDGATPGLYGAEAARTLLNPLQLLRG